MTATQLLQRKCSTNKTQHLVIEVHIFINPDVWQALKQAPGYSLWLAAYHHTTPHHIRFTALFLGPPGWAGARRELMDFMLQGKINRGRHIDHPAVRHSSRTNQCPPPPSHFYRPDILPVAQPTVSKHWRQQWLVWHDDLALWTASTVIQNETWQTVAVRK